MLKRLGICLVENPELIELHVVQQIMIPNSLDDMRVIRGKMLLH